MFFEPKVLFRSLVFLGVFLYSGWTVYVVWKDRPLDFYLYYIAAREFTIGTDLYGMGDLERPDVFETWRHMAQDAGVSSYGKPYRYPPLTAVLALPLTCLSPRGGAVIWLLFTSLLFLLSGWLLGRTLPGRYGPCIGMAWVVLFVPVLTTLDTGQINGAVLFSLCLALIAHQWQRPWLIGFGLATGAMLKMIPAAHLGYLGFRNFRAAFFWGVLGIIFFFLLCGAFLGWNNVPSFFHNFMSLSPSDTILRRGCNQAFSGFITRLMTDPEPTPESLETAQRVWKLCSLGLVIATVALCFPRGKKDDFFAVEFALITCSVSLITPYVWYHQLVLLLIPYTVLTGCYLKGLIRTLFMVCMVIGYILIDIHGIIWKHLEFNAFLVSFPFFVTLFLWLALAELIVRFKFMNTQGSLSLCA